jgi:hypothetical protein
LYWFGFSLSIKEKGVLSRAFLKKEVAGGILYIRSQCKLMTYQKHFSGDFVEQAIMLLHNI